MKTLINRLKEVSTWQGIITILAGFGVVISPELSEAIIATATGVFALVSILWKERGSKDSK